MDELIEKLSKEANAWYPMGYPSGEGGDAAWQNLVIFEREDLEKFAELIVRECLAECWYDATPKQIADNIRQKFGVEE